VIWNGLKEVFGRHEIGLLPRRLDADRIVCREKLRKSALGRQSYGCKMRTEGRSEWLAKPYSFALAGRSAKVLLTMATNGLGVAPSESQGFVKARGRPALFLFTASEVLQTRHVFEMSGLVHDHEFEELDLVIHSGGGSAHSAYQIIELLRLHTERLNACVPFWAKSAATLLCIGADKIVLGEHAELGPLDVQIYEERKAGQGEYSSALDLFKTLQQVQTAAILALTDAMRSIVGEYRMSYDESLTHAIEFVAATTGPLVGKLDPQRLGRYSRELTVAVEYGQRLLTRYSRRDPVAASQLTQQLVYGYPSHEYIIDYKELMELGLDVELFDDKEERSAVKELLSLAEKDFITLVMPEGNKRQGSLENGLAEVTTSRPTGDLEETV
jgi:hypothetical protein